MTSKNLEIRDDQNQGGPDPIPPRDPFFPAEGRTTRIRGLGWLLVTLSSIVIAGMVTFTFIFVLLMSQGMMLQRFGSYAVLFVVVILFGICVLIGGVRMIRTGRRSMWTLAFIVGLILVLGGVARIVMSAGDDGSNTRSNGRGKDSLARTSAKTGSVGDAAIGAIASL